MENKIKPIISRQMLIETRDNYRTLRKKGYRILPKLEVDKTIYLSSRFPPSSLVLEQAVQLSKLFKALKYVHKLDLSKMIVGDRASYLSKMIYFIKRNSKAKNIKIHDSKLAYENFKGVSEVWPKYSQAVQVFEYSFKSTRKRTDPSIYIPPEVPDPSVFKNFCAFIRLLKYQPRVKDLTIQFPGLDESQSQEYWKFERYPTSLERLSFKGIEYEDSITSSIYHLKNLKHLGIEFLGTHSGSFLVSMMKLIPQVSSHLESLSLNWNETFAAYVSSALGELKELDNLRKLKLNIQLSSFLKFETISQTFEKCPLTHLTLLIQVDSQEELISIANFLNKLNHLSHLRLHIRYKDFNPDSDILQNIFRQIDDLLLLKKLSISVNSVAARNNWDQKSLPVQQLQGQIFTKIFTKTVPLESFKIQFKPISILKQDFLQLITALEPLNSTLTKLRIDIGNYNLESAEFQNILEFLKNLQNIRSLRLESLNIPCNASFSDLVDIICQKRYFRTLALGHVEIKEERAAGILTLKRILQKNGLRKFAYQKCTDFGSLLFGIKREEIEQKNPFFRKAGEMFGTGPQHEFW